MQNNVNYRTGQQAIKKLIRNGLKTNLLGSSNCPFNQNLLTYGFA